MISAPGQWSWGDNDCTADGTKGRPNAEERPSALFPSGRFGELYGRVGEWTFPVGSSAQVTAQASGELSFIMNDRVGFYGDNSGELAVEVSKR